jgi:hypothetical protein
MKLCAKCKTNERFSEKNSYCRPCKNAGDLKSYHNHNEKRRKYMKEYLIKNPHQKELKNKLVKEWRLKNPNYITDWGTNKRKTDPQYAIKSVIYGSLHGYLKNGKKEHAIWYLGCTWEEFKIHLENQFTDGMTWENRGVHGWHIDHIKPVNTFDLTDPIQLKECWNYTNLRPLWAKDNLSRPDDGSDMF